MVAIAQKTLSFEEFLNWDDESGRSFELVNGVAMPLSEPTAKHEDVVDGLCRLLVDHCQSLNLPYVPRQSKQVRLNAAPAKVNRVVKPTLWCLPRKNGSECVKVLPLLLPIFHLPWRSKLSVRIGGSDYRIKLNEYETLGILEYWIVDCAGLGGVQYMGSPKQSTVTINCLIDGEYQALRYQGEAIIVSPTFPQLVLTIAQIVAMTEV